ncbi:putative flippase GtrA [Rubricella aquisinus]|uniref:Putative flippase GtrA n=1 Tax=Rubricella aquisinus TaxID=2028108 RepID=A0A840WWG9_9RHOB|nr:CTP synthetase [Rubricella aquisinus]MBB5514644.1 putative flippase GtrA [Rubricella aquisinus]
MIRLMGILFGMISTTLMGVGVIVVLVMGAGTLMPILGAAAVGFLVSIPITYVIARAVAET